MVSKSTATPKRAISKSKISSKYQIVLPKELRNVLHDVTPGAVVYMVPSGKNKITLTVEKESWATQNYGVLPYAAFAEDPAITIRKLRDANDKRLKKKLAAAWKDTND